jgi:hypothetical protein
LINIPTTFNSSDFPNSLSCLLNPGLGSAIDLEHLIDLNISVHSISVTAIMYAMVKVVEREIPAKLMVTKSQMVVRFSCLPIGQAYETNTKFGQIYQKTY